ncbi:MAG: hypothetical protein ABI317_09175 [Gaiellales bacterium]
MTTRQLVTSPFSTEGSARANALATSGESLEKSSIFYARAANTLAITGGTGSYKAAKGKLTLRDLTTKTTAGVFTFR